MTSTIVDLFCTPKQKIVFQSQDYSLKTLIQHALKGSVEEAKKANLVLDAIPLLDKADQRIIKTLLWNLDSISLKHLQQLYKVLLTKANEPFCQCISSNKTCYYPIDKLIHVIETFSSILEHVNKGNPFPLQLATCPNFDNGGEAFLHQLRLNLSNQDPVTPADTLTALLEHQGSFLEIKSHATQYLSSLPAENRAEMGVYPAFFKNLAEAQFKDSEKIEILKMAVAITSSPTHPHSQVTIDQLRELIGHALSIYNGGGDRELKFICKRLTTSSLDQVLSIFKALAHLYQDFERDIAPIQKLLLDFTNPEQLSRALESQMSVQKPLPEEKDSADIFKRFESDESVKFPLPSERLAAIKKQYDAKVVAYCKAWKSLTMPSLVKMALEIRDSNDPESEENTLKLIAIGRLALRFHHHYPHITQVLTVLAQLTFDKGCFAQVKTGEGKSLIVALMAFVLAMRKKEIHVITSNDFLATDAQRRFAPFFKEFGIKTTHICKQDSGPKDFEGQILYGTTHHFMFAIMREMLCFEKLFPTDVNTNRDNRYALVDEADNLTIDNRSDARLALPAEFTVEWVYVPILEFVKPETTHLKDIKNIASELRTHLNDYMGGKFRLQTTFLSDQQLQDWFTSARIAFHSMKELVNYVICEQEVSIIDVDNGGNIQEGCRWNRGVHEFVEAKHDLVIERESLTPIQLSHSVFYKIYRTLFGLTGTMGEQVEREEVKKIYGVDSFDVPTYCEPKRIELPTIICPTRESHYKTIIQKMSAHREKGRPSLFNCRTIEQNRDLAREVSKHDIPFKLFNAIQAEHDDEILDEAGKERAVTIATSVAARGIDIILKDNSAKNGGLAQYTLYFPKSKRLEDQQRGRAGRQGQPGSSQIIICAEDYPHIFGTHILNANQDQLQQFLHHLIELQLTTEREMLNLVQSETHYKQVQNERFSFDFIQKFYTKLKDFHSKVVTNEKLLRKFAAILGPRKITIVKNSDFSRHAPKDRVIAQDALSLLTSRVNEETKWLTLLKQAGERLQHKAISSWAINYVEKVDKDRDSEFDIFKTKCLDIFKSESDKWEKDLDLSGEGILAYLREMTGASLKIQT